MALSVSAPGLQCKKDYRFGLWGARDFGTLVKKSIDVEMIRSADFDQAKVKRSHQKHWIRRLQVGKTELKTKMNLRQLLMRDLDL